MPIPRQEHEEMNPKMDPIDKASLILCGLAVIFFVAALAAAVILET